MRNILRSNLREIKKYYLKRSSILPNKLSKSLDDEMKEWIIEELKQLSEAETNANLKRILEGSLN